MINSMTTPNGQLFDTTIMDEHSCQFVNGFTGEVIDEMPWQELNAKELAEVLSTDCTTEPIKDLEWWKK
jgi:hypothetical protein